MNYRANRWANIVIGMLQTIAVIASLLVARPASYYAFFAGVEIVTTCIIVWYAGKWSNPEIH